MLTLADYLMGREKTFPEDFSPEIRNSAIALLSRVNALLEDLQIFDAHISSGWRPPSVNAQVPGAAPHSQHVTGHALDLSDVYRFIARKLLRDPTALEEHGLYLEDPAKSRGHVHLQDVPPASGKRIFEP